jgi:hypothetical protein
MEQLLQSMLYERDEHVMSMMSVLYERESCQHLQPCKHALSHKANVQDQHPNLKLPAMTRLNICQDLKRLYSTEHV